MAGQDGDRVAAFSFPFARHDGIKIRSIWIVVWYRDTMRAVLFTLVLFLSFSRVQADDFTDWYTQRDLQQPRRDHLMLCHGFGCAFHTPIRMSNADIAALTRIMNAKASDAAAERQNLAHAEAWFEQRILADVGGHSRHQGYFFGAQIPGEMDCIDLATNTTSLLALIQANNLMRFHEVSRPESRGYVFVWAHATAVVIEKSTGTRYALDPWPRAPRTGPDVMPLQTWFANVGNP